jgi:hypothetical protein
MPNVPRRRGLVGRLRVIGAEEGAIAAMACSEPAYSRRSRPRPLVFYRRQSATYSTVSADRGRPVSPGACLRWFCWPCWFQSQAGDSPSYIPDRPHARKRRWTVSKD